MAYVSRGSLRAASVVCIPPISRLHARLGQALGVSITDPGKPGSAHVFDSEGTVPPRSERSDFGIKYLFDEVLSKFDDGLPSPTKDATTWSRFWEAEALCSDANQRLRWIGDSSPFAQEISLAQKLASKILGPFEWNAAAAYFAWGPGASTRQPRRKSDAAYKYAGTPHTTKGNAALAHACIKMDPNWEKSISPYAGEDAFGYCKIVPGNRVVTVPKNYKTDRTIAIEPCMNMYVQKGIGGLMRKRLREAGCDLNDQSRNQRLALIGSLANSLATIDLSMASDCISRAVVSLLIRPDWVAALEQCRSPFGVLASDQRVFWQKFSSMGNGFTFELESVIFYALALACTSLEDESTHRVSVYGDDVIIPVTAAPRFMRLITYLGFKPNEKKSHVDGKFRESCGKHYSDGDDVTPFYIKKQPKTLKDLFLLHNQVYRFAMRSRDWLSDEHLRNLRSFCHWLRSFAPAQWRKPRLPDGYGDGAFIGSFEECLPSRAAHNIEGFAVKHITSETVDDDRYDHPGLLVKALRQSHDCRNADYVSPIKIGEREQLRAFPAKGTRDRLGVILVRQFTTASPWSGIDLG